MSADRFSDCLAFTWRPQYDGQGYHVTEGDTGGPTSWGVTEGSWGDWCNAHPYAGLPDLAHATPALFKPMIRSRYWLPIQGDLLPPGVDLLVYDFGYGSGPHTSAIELQRVLRMNLVDGWVGPATAAAAAKRDRAELINTLSAAHLGYLQSCSGWPLFGHGWTNRNTARVSLAREMAGITAGAVFSARTGTTTNAIVSKTV